MVGRLIRGSYYKLKSYRFHTAFFLLPIIVLMGITSPHRAKWDFGVYYKAGQNFLSKTAIYVQNYGHEEFKYSPFFAFIFSPFTFLEEIPALYLWNLLNGVLFCCTVLLLFKMVNLPFFQKKTLMLLFLILLYSAGFLIRNIKIGQSNILLLFLLTAAFYVLFTKKNEFWGALALAMSLTIKFFPLIFLAYFFVARKFKFVIYTLIILMIMILIPAFYTGFDLYGAHLRQWFEMLQANPVRQIYSSKNNSILSFYSWFSILGQHDIARFWDYFEIVTPLAKEIYILWFITGICFFVFFFFDKFFQKNPEICLLDFAALCILSLIFNPVAFKELFIFVIVPIFLIFHVLMWKSGSKAQKMFIGSLCCLSFALFVFFKSTFFIPSLFFYLTLFKPLLRGVFVLFILLWILKYKFKSSDLTSPI